MRKISRVLAAAMAVAVAPAAGSAAIFDVTINGGAAIFLAGRTDLVIPPANQPWGDGSAATEDGMRRHAGPTPEEVLETLPPEVPVMGGDVVRVLDPAIGGINYFNGFGPGFFGPEGNGGTTSSSLASFGAISGYRGTQGALTGVFLTDAIPTGAAPPATLPLLDRNFLALSPLIGQIFFVGDGQTDGGVFQEFLAPAGATRLALGIPDGFGFVGVPGAYDDNDGAYRIRVGVNAIPTPPQIPLPAPLALLASGLAALGVASRRKR